MSFDLELLNSDLRIKSDGNLSTVSDTPKLRQDIIKIITTELGSNVFHRWYGCSVGKNTIGKNLPANVLDMEIRTSIEQSLERLKTLQQSQKAVQEVSLAEMISEIGTIFAERDLIDPRQVSVFVEVLTKRLSKVEEIFTLSS